MAVCSCYVSASGTGRWDIVLILPTKLWLYGHLFHRLWETTVNEHEHQSCPLNKSEMWAASQRSGARILMQNRDGSHFTGSAAVQVNTLWSSHSSLLFHHSCTFGLLQRTITSKHGPNMSVNLISVRVQVSWSRECFIVAMPGFNTSTCCSPQTLFGFNEAPYAQTGSRQTGGRSL